MTLDKFSISNLILSPDFGFFVLSTLPVIIILPLSIFLLNLPRCFIIQLKEFNGSELDNLASPIKILFQYNFELSLFKSKSFHFGLGVLKIIPDDQALSAINVNASRLL